MNNEPVAWISRLPEGDVYNCAWAEKQNDDDIPLYTHPVKELHLSLQKSKQTGELLAVTYTDDEHRIVEVLWQRPPVKELTDEEILEVIKERETPSYMNFARAILRKAQEK